jgi:hypothetical protein
MKWRKVSATETIAVLEQPDREEKAQVIGSMPMGS